MDDFAEMYARYDATEFLNASLIVPVDFTGLIKFPAQSIYDDVTNVFSAQRLRAAIAPIAAEVGLPAGLPSGPMTLTTAINDPPPSTWHCFSKRRAFPATWLPADLRLAVRPRPTCSTVSPSSTRQSSTTMPPANGAEQPGVTARRRPPRGRRQKRKPGRD
ncbi:hypothetical protein ACQP2P_15810 [Dactylosporangium sp. CA-139114]|uniref:hypothetical protein n=1 Tax=Dactylosporangium sp. CA-139114 TaxID=3239931 RepID=UPI003D954966